MSLLSRLLMEKEPQTLDQLLDACEHLIERQKFRKAIRLAEAYGDRLFKDGDITQPREFFQLGSSHLFALAAAYEECAGLSGSKLEKAIVSMACRRRYIVDLLERASADSGVSPDCSHYRDVADATINGLVDNYRDNVDVAMLIVRGDEQYFAHREKQGLGRLR